jgi:hypothetical protein
MPWVKDRLRIGQERGRIRCSKDDFEYFDLTGYTPFLGSAGAFLSRLAHLVATVEAMARFGASHPQGRADHHAYAGSGTNGDDLPRFEVTLEC